ncbi:hypothetical protein GCM10028784_35680 [Myceligenerans cantabricum]
MAGVAAPAAAVAMATVAMVRETGTAPAFFFGAACFKELPPCSGALRELSRRVARFESPCVPPKLGLGRRSATSHLWFARHRAAPGMTFAEGDGTDPLEVP